MCNIQKRILVVSDISEMYFRRGPSPNPLNHTARANTYTLLPPLFHPSFILFCLPSFNYYLWSIHYVHGIALDAIDQRHLIMGKPFLRKLFKDQERSTKIDPSYIL